MPFNGLPSNSGQGSSSVRATTLLPEVPDHVFASSDIDGICNTFKATTTSGTLQTVLNIGSLGPQAGVLTMAAVWTGTAAVSPTLKITLDGKVVYNNASAIVQNGIRVAAGIFGSDGAGPPTLVTGDQSEVVFNKSCLVQFSSSGGNTTECYYNYRETEG